MFMDDIGIGFWLFCSVISILNIILFFKIWAMTSDVNSIKRIMQGETVANEKPDDGTSKIVFITFMFVLFVIIITTAISGIQ